MSDVIKVRYANKNYKPRRYLKIVASIYIAKLGNKICDFIEKDHKIMWGKINDFYSINVSRISKAYFKRITRVRSVLEC